MSLLSAQNLLRGKTTFWCSNYCFPLQTSNWRSMLHFKTHWFTISLAFLLKCFLSRVYFYFILKSLRSGSWIFTPSWEGTRNLKEEDTHQEREKWGMQIRFRRVGKGGKEISLFIGKIQRQKKPKGQNSCWRGKMKKSKERKQKAGQRREPGAQPNKVQLLPAWLELLFIASAVY